MRPYQIGLELPEMEEDEVVTTLELATATGLSA